ncbi:MAG TPA: alpha-isopropylmalate synthase regulatory domain-containing protein [Blastocatellia bacterium]|nr:alpha-isopropylmalate synthase regulatory domain-containing protein [Blastocatellia bacterium]
MTNTPQKRIRFDQAETTRQDDERCHVEVTLSFADRVLKASAAEPCEGVGPLKAAARAALEAMEEAVEGRFRCKLADLDHVNALGKNLIAVLVDIDFEGKQVQVFGSCQLSGNEIDAAVKAALNATNRFFDLAQK